MNALLSFVYKTMKSFLVYNMLIFFKKILKIIFTYLLLLLSITTPARACDFDQLTYLGTLRYEALSPWISLKTATDEEWDFSSIKIVDKALARTLLTPLRRKELQAFTHPRLLGRYGERIVELGHENIWLQELLVASGAAIVWPSKGQRTCLPYLRSVQHTAFEKKAGWWGAHSPLDLNSTKKHKMNTLAGIHAFTARIAFARERKKQILLYLGSKDNSLILEIEKQGLQLLFPKVKSLEELDLKELAGISLNLVGHVWQTAYGPRVTLSDPSHIIIADNIPSLDEER